MADKGKIILGVGIVAVVIVLVYVANRYNVKAVKGAAEAYRHYTDDLKARWKKIEDTAAKARANWAGNKKFLENEATRKATQGITLPMYFDYSPQNQATLNQMGAIYFASYLTHGGRMPI